MLFLTYYAQNYAGIIGASLNYVLASKRNLMLCDYLVYFCSFTLGNMQKVMVIIPYVLRVLNHYLLILVLPTSVSQ